jgi:hypothetical protein
MVQTLAHIEPLHGYGIARRIAQVSGEAVLHEGQFMPRRRHGGAGAYSYRASLSFRL